MGLSESEEKDKKMKAIRHSIARTSAHIWVSAHAGSGKTKVLVDRFLVLLLKESGHVERILCLTYTRAAATEMMLRINRVLSEWSLMSAAALRHHLQDLLCREPSDHEVYLAGQLFYSFAHKGGHCGGILTLHGFCHAFLRRFALEAGIPVDFDVVDSAVTASLFEEAMDHVIVRYAEHWSLGWLVRFFRLGTLKHYLRLSAELLQTRSVSMTIDSVVCFLSKACGYDAFSYQDQDWILPGEDLLCGASVLGVLPALKAEAYDKLIEGIEQFAEGSLDVSAYIALWLTQEGQPLKRLVSKKFTQLFPEEYEILQTEQERCFQMRKMLDSRNFVVISASLYFLALELSQELTACKKKNGYLDYYDLLKKTQELLSDSQFGAWIRYKTDGEIYHILLDEAQDTTPQQWAIVHDLISDFFSGEGQHAAERTCFIVGDIKQSIYGFQGAYPEHFLAMRERFHDYAMFSSQSWEELTLDYSFRSNRFVLQFIDAVCMPLLPDLTPHYPWRTDEEGSVTVWPLVSLASDEEEVQAAVFLVDSLCAMVGHLFLPSVQRVAEFSDILVLFQRRSGWYNVVLRELDRRGIVSTSSGQSVLKHEFCVRDLLSVARFSLYVQDDLALAEILKGSLGGWSDDDLYRVGFGRRGSLWEALRSQEDFQDFVAWLESMQHLIHETPFNFFYHILTSVCWVHQSVGLTGKEAIVLRLGERSRFILDDFLRVCENYQGSSLQIFLHWFDNREFVVTQNAEESGESCLRVMTVHGAKGLQAPIVIIADAASPLPRRSEVMMCFSGEGDIPILSSTLPHGFNTRYLMHGDGDEQVRLLYVALTRAADHLHIFSFTRSSKDINKNWHSLIKDALAVELGWEPIDFMYCDQIYTRHVLGHATLSEIPISFNNELSLYPEEVAEDPLTFSQVIPSIFQKPLVFEDVIHRQEKISQGILLHQIFEMCSRYPDSQRESLLKKRFAHLIDLQKNKSIIDKALHVLRTLDSALPSSPLWDHPEVTLTGFYEGQRVVCRFDRLLVTESEVVFVEYKTGDTQKIAFEERQQIKKYYTILQDKFINHRVSCYFIRTSLCDIQYFSEYMIVEDKI